MFEAPPGGQYSDMPQLVSGPGEGAFISPPPGASTGGRPGLFDAFPGVSGGGPSASWPPPFNSFATPFPHSAGLPNLQVPPAWATAQQHPQYPPFQHPQQQAPQSAPAFGWGPPSGGGGSNPNPNYPAFGGGLGGGVGWPSSPMPVNGGYTPFGGGNPSGGGGPSQNGYGTPFGYTPWSAPVSGPGYVPWGSTVGAGGSASAGADGVTSGGFFGANGGGGGGGGGGNGISWDLEGEERQRNEQRRRRKRSNSMKRSVSGDERVGVRSATPKGSTPLMRSLSLSGVGGAGYTPWVGAGGTGGGGGYTPWVGATGYPTGGGGGAGGAAAGGWGVGFSGFPPLAGEEYGPRNLARRPRDWRADYNPRGGLSILPGFVTKGRSDVQDYHDPQRRMLHPLLQYQANNPPISHDLRVNPFDTSRYDLFVNLARAHNQIDFAQLATQPAASMMRLYHPHLPWYIDVKPSHPNGVTVHDVLMYVYRQLMTPISGRHFWNEELGEEEREGVTKAFWERCGTSQGEVGRGVLQVDFLGRRVIFEGLARGRGGIWEIKTSKVDPR